MKLKTLLLICSFLFSYSSFAQNTYSVKGSVADTAAKSKLANASISILNSKDSTLVKFTRAGSTGAFAIPNLKKGKFILLVTYPEYADYVDRFSLDSVNTSHDFGSIKMLLKSKVLADVIVKAKRAAIKIKGDTTEFDAKAFVVQPNATVEDLLKQLPGIQVDKDGKITAQGQTVPKVLVDGEEFFGDDPTLVTKNLRADMVDKVQLYDKKSDQATFTGIDDGQKTKTINIKLKEDKKNGYFGKAEAGGGTDGYYQGSLLYNRFKAKQKLSAYAIAGNNGKVGLGWDDSQKYGTDAANVEFGDDGSVSFFVNGDGDGLDSWGGQYSGQGLPIARTGGIHYDTKWNKDKESLNTNYKIGSLTVDGTQSTLSQNNTADGALNSSSDQLFHKYIFRQKLDATYNLKIDSTQNLKIMVDGTLKNGQTTNNNNSESDKIGGTKASTFATNTINNTDGKIFDISAFYTKKFKKKGRTFSLSIAEAINQSSGHGYLRSESDLYGDNGLVDSVSKVDQFKTNSTNSSILTTNATYTEPLAKSLSLIFNYAVRINHSTSNIRSFDQSAPGVYNVQDSLLSSNYRLNELSNQVGAILNYKTKKATFNFGTKVSNVNFNQLNEFTGAPFKRDFVNWAPQASYEYRFSQQQSLYISYRGTTEQPSISQIQPILNNNDPQNTILGNPDLRPSFNNSINLYFNSYKVITGQSVWLNGGFNFTNNAIVSDLSTDTVTNKTKSRYTNLNGKTPYNYYFRANFNRKIQGPDFNLGLVLALNGSTSYSISRILDGPGDLNRTILDNYSAQLRLSKYKEKKYDIYATAGPNYTISNSSLNKLINNNGRGFNADGGFNIYLPAKFQVGSDVDYQYTAKTETFDRDQKKTLLNANITKTFFKNDDLKLTLWANDLLNQNVGFTRSVNGNFISQSNYTTIKRYFMFTVTWNFNSMAVGAAKK